MGTRIGLGLRFLCLLLGFWGAVAIASACNLPIDPYVCVVPTSGTEVAATVDSSQSHVCVEVDEGTPVTFQAYMDITGREGDLPTELTWHGRDLISLPTMQALAELKLKFGELMTRNGFALTDTDAIGFGGNIKGLFVSGNVDGNSNLNGVGDFAPTAVGDLADLLPNPANGDAFRKFQGTTKKWEVKSGQYTTDGSIKLDSISSSFEWDKSGIGHCSGSGGGADGSAQGTFQVVTKPYYYKNVGYVDMTFSISNVKWEWVEAYFEADASGTWHEISSRDMSMTISGTMTRTSTGAGGTGGHPGYFYVRTRDVTPAVYSCMTTRPEPTGTTGGTPNPSSLEIEFELVDNNPIEAGLTQTSIPVDCFYSLCVTDYKPGNYNVPGTLMDKLKFAEYKDKFVWKMKSANASKIGYTAYNDAGPTTIAAAETIPGGIGEVLQGPVTYGIGKWRATFPIDDKLPLHYCKDSVSCAGSNGGALLDWGSKRHKYFILPKDDGNGKGFIGWGGPTTNVEDEKAKEDGYDGIMGDFPAVTKHVPPEEFDLHVTGPEQDTAKALGNCGKFGEITDNDPPNLFLCVRDTRMNKVHIFGNNTATLDSDQFPSPSNKTDNNHARDDTAAGFTFDQGGTDDESGYGDFVAKYATEYNFHNSGDDNTGLWVDEDTRLEFSCFGYDNINTYNPSHGLSGASGGVSSGNIQTWWNWHANLGFSLRDEPGNYGPADPFPQYIFRYPNRPKEPLNDPGNMTITAQCSDGRGGSRTITVNVWAIWNKKDIRALEERKYRK